MLRDISDWEHKGHGGNSTLPKEELLAPDDRKYYIKYPREVEVGVAWEDITELVAAQIASILGLRSMDVEIVTRNSRRGCLLRNFVDELNPKANEEGGALLEVYEEYQELLNTSLTGNDLIDSGFKVLQLLPYWKDIKQDYIDMLFFDILIGNQDRHPFNWMILFISEQEVKFSPIYDNGASLGFRFENIKLREMLTNEAKLNKYFKNTKTKAGIFEKKQVKAKVLMKYLLKKYPTESEKVIKRIRDFDLEQYSLYINSVKILSEDQRNWLLTIIPFRRRKMIELIDEE